MNFSLMLNNFLTVLITHPYLWAFLFVLTFLLKFVFMGEIRDFEKKGKIHNASYEFCKSLFRGSKWSSAVFGLLFLASLILNILA